MLSKRHNILSYHQVREAIAAKIFAFHWCDSSQNKSDVLSKHWDNDKAYHNIKELFDYQGKIVLLKKKCTSLYLKKGSDMIHKKTQVFMFLRF